MPSQNMRDYMRARRAAQRGVSDTRQRTCDACGESFTPKRSDARYCGDACRAAARRNRPTPEGAPQKMKYHILRHDPAKFDRNHSEFLTSWSFYSKAWAEHLSPGDRVFVYSGAPVFELCAIAKVADAEAYEGTTAPSGWSADEVGKRPWIRDLEDARLLEQPVPLSVLEADPRIAGSRFLRMAGGHNPHPLTDTAAAAILEAIVLASLKSTDTAAV